MSVEAVIFDMDGTLVDSMPYHMESWRIFFERHQVNLTKEEFDAVHHGTVYDIMPRIFGAHITSQDSQQLGNEKESLYRELYRGQVEPTKGLQKLLHAIQEEGLPMAIATAADDANAHFIMDELNIRSFFNVVMTSDNVQEGKPSPRVYLETAAALNIQPQNCLVFEDTISGIAAAKAAGMKVVGLTTGLASEQILAHGAERAIVDFEAITFSQIEDLFA